MADRQFGAILNATAIRAILKPGACDPWAAALDFASVDLTGLKEAGYRMKKAVSVQTAAVTRH